MRKIIIGDVHGCLQELQELLERCKIQPTDTLIFIGDLISKGPDSVGTVQFVRSLSKTYQVQLILGNHEKKLLRYQHHKEHNAKALHDMLDNGGYEQISSQLTHADWAFLRRAFFFLRLNPENIFVVHGGIPQTCSLDFSRVIQYESADPRMQKAYTLLTMTRHLDAKGNFLSLGQEQMDSVFWAATYDGRLGHVVFGHQPFLQEGPKVFPHAHGIDNGCVFGGWLTALIVEGSSPAYSVSVKAAYTYAPLLPKTIK